LEINKPKKLVFGRLKRHSESNKVLNERNKPSNAARVFYFKIIQTFSLTDYSIGHGWMYLDWADISVVVYRPLDVRKIPESIALLTTQSGDEWH
jgi:hypothetical protein